MAPTVPDTLERVELGAYARQIGATPESLRKRIRRGTLHAEKVDDRWYVLVDASLPPSPPDGQPDAGQDTSLVRALEDQIAWLRGELERRAAEGERYQVLLAEALSAARTPQLTAPEPAPTLSAPSTAPGSLWERFTRWAGV